MSLSRPHFRGHLGGSVTSSEESESRHHHQTPPAAPMPAATSPLRMASSRLRPLSARRNSMPNTTLPLHNSAPAYRPRPPTAAHESSPGSTDLSASAPKIRWETHACPRPPSSSPTGSTDFSAWPTATERSQSTEPPRPPPKIRRGGGGSPPKIRCEGVDSPAKVTADLELLAASGAKSICTNKRDHELC